MAKTVLGLDIGTTYIKFVELAHIGKSSYSLVSVGLTPAPLKGVSSEAAIDQETLAVTIKKLLKDGGVKTKSANIALPEAHVFTRIITVPPLSERELASAIKWEAEQYIPLPLEEVNMDFSIVGQSQDKGGNKKLDVLLVAAPKTMIARYTKILDMCNIEITALETEIIAASRSLLSSLPSRPTAMMVVNFGARSTDLSILRNGIINFTRSVPTGGEHFTRALAQDLGFPTPQAEEYKKTYGLQQNQLEGKVYRSLKPLFSVVVDEMKRSITFFQNKYPDEVISMIIVSGGSAKLPGLVTSLAQELGTETIIGNAWIRVSRDQKRFGKLDDEGAAFVVAVGLAMREG